MKHAPAGQETVPLRAHSSLAPFAELSERTGFRFGFIGDPPEVRNLLDWVRIPALRQFWYAQTIHFQMAKAIMRARRPDVFFLVTINPIYSLPIYLALLLRGRPAFFLVHGAQQIAGRSALHRVALEICRFAVRCAELYPVHLELGDACLPPAARFPENKSLCVPHPHPLAENPLPPRARTGPLRVGVVGLLRGDKPIDGIIRALAGLQDEIGFRLVLGTPLWQKPAWVDALPVEIVDTSSPEQYFGCLSALDVIIVDFRRSDYWFRPSGVIIDAAMCGCAAICPDYPVLANEITQPCRIGLTFSSLDEVASLLREMKASLASAPPDFAVWREPRRMENIAALFRAFLEKRGFQKRVDQGVT